MNNTHTNYTIQRAEKVLFDGMGTVLKGWEVRLHYANGQNERFTWNKTKKACQEEAKKYSL